MESRFKTVRCQSVWLSYQRYAARQLRMSGTLRMIKMCPIPDIIGINAHRTNRPVHILSVPTKMKVSRFEKASALPVINQHQESFHFNTLAYGKKNIIQIVVVGCESVRDKKMSLNLLKNGQLQRHWCESPCFVVCCPENRVPHQSMNRMMEGCIARRCRS